MEISPVYRIDLVRKIEEKLLNKYSYDEVE